MADLAPLTPPRTRGDGWRDELRATLRLSWPLATANLLQMLTYAIDVIFIARLGEDQLAASALAVAVFGLATIIFGLSQSMPLSLAMLSETYVVSDEVAPRNAPGWFDCFDAKAIAEEIEAGTALTFLGQKNVHFGVDRIVAITSDGRGYVWHELNDCGDKAYDGTVVGEACPERPAD